MLLLAKPREQTHVIHEALDEIFVAVRLAVEDQKTLVADFGARDFDFEFVFFVGFVGWLGCH